jgi:hypothetical protein
MLLLAPILNPKTRAIGAKKAPVVAKIDWLDTNINWRNDFVF